MSISSTLPHLEAELTPRFKLETNAPSARLRVNIHEFVAATGAFVGDVTYPPSD